MMVMDDNGEQTKKAVVEATVVCNKQIRGSFYRLSVEFADSGVGFAGYKPGQFVQIDLSRTSLPAAARIPEELAESAERAVLLRRPFSFADFDVSNGKIKGEILYCVVGPSSLRMTTLSKGDKVSMIGPLGNGFWVSEGKKKALMVTGGIGTGPVLHLAKMISKNRGEIEMVGFAGAKSKLDLPFERPLDSVSQGIGYCLAEFSKYGAMSLVATDDGSMGYKGVVTDCVADWLEKNEISPAETIIYSCGPEAMLKALASVAAKHNIDCQISMERRMGCGFGVCQSCAIECKVGEGNQTEYKMCCKDGPVFEAKNVIFSV